MKLGVLFSGGKDSTLALHKAAEKDEVACLITLVSENKESFMFHTPNIDVTALQAEAFGLPLVQKATAGKPEAELKDLEEAIAQAVKAYKIAGVVSGATGSRVFAGAGRDNAAKSALGDPPDSPGHDSGTA